MPYDPITDDYGHMLNGSEAERIAEELRQHRDNVFVALRKAASECEADIRALVYMENADVASLSEAGACLDGYDWGNLADILELAGVHPAQLPHAIAAE